MSFSMTDLANYCRLALEQFSRVFSRKASCVAASHNAGYVHLTAAQRHLDTEPSAAVLCPRPASSQHDSTGCRRSRAFISSEMTAHHLAGPLARPAQSLPWLSLTCGVLSRPRNDGLILRALGRASRSSVLGAP